MASSEAHGPWATAKYTPQRIARYQGNPLIEALPPVMDDETLMESMTLLPDFNPEQREWPTHERMLQLAGLNNFLLPLRHQIQLARTLETMIREGYVGRAPRNARHHQVFQSLYGAQSKGSAHVQQPNAVNPQLSTALVGLSGMGKTTTVRRALSLMPPVIFHPELRFWQVPYLLIETPSDGRSVKGLGQEILMAMDRLLPGANYYHDYAVKSRPSAESLMRHAAHVLNMHLVGALVADEIQNVGNARKSSSTVMSELVTACNRLGVPILFVGTNAARNVLSKDLRQARRSTGFGMAPWGRLVPAGSNEDPDGEWDDFIGGLWRYQWVRNPTQLTPQLSSVLYHCTQGIIGLAIRLFAAAQVVAMSDATETLSAELILRVYKQEFSLVDPMVEALRNNDLTALAQFEDIAPLDLTDMVEDLARRHRGRKIRAASVGPSSPEFVPRVATSLMATGVDEGTASELAEAVAAEGSVSNTLDGTAKALAKLAEPKVRAKSKAKGAPADVPDVDLSERPDDYRRALVEARRSGKSVVSQLEHLGMVADLESVLRIA